MKLTVIKVRPVFLAVAVMALAAAVTSRADGKPTTVYLPGGVWGARILENGQEALLYLMFDDQGNYRFAQKVKDKVVSRFSGTYTHVNGKLTLTLNGKPLTTITISPLGANLFRTTGGKLQSTWIRLPQKQAS